MKTRNNFLITLAVQLAILTSCNPEQEDLQQPTQDQWTYYTITNGLPTNFIVSLYEDKKGRLWIGTDRGLSMYDGTTFTNYSTNDGLLSNTVYAVLEDKDGKIWAGTPNGLNILQDGEWFYFTFFYEKAVFSLLELSNQDILIGTGGEGVYQANFSKNAIEAFHVTENCLECNTVFALYSDIEENIWIGSLAGAKKIKDQNIVKFDKTNGLSGNFVTSFCEDSFGNIWVGCVDGTTVSRIAGNHVEQIYFSNGSPQNLTRDIEMDDDENIWIGTVQMGVYKYDGAFLGRVYDGPPGNSVQALLRTTDGALWIGTRAGLVRYVAGIH